MSVAVFGDLRRRGGGVSRKERRLKFRLTGNVSEFGLFRGFAATRTRLIASVAGATALTWGLGYLGATYIMDQSGSVGLNILLIALMMLCVMITAYLQGVLVGDVFFKGAWREQVILGKRAQGQERVVLKDHNAEFFIVIFLLVLGNAFLIDTVAGDFFETYHNEAFFRARLRAGDPQERISALRDVADPTQYELWANETLQQILTTALDDPAAQVREQAAWSLGVMGVKGARPGLRALLSPSQPDAVRAEAALALARLGPQDGDRLVVEQILGEEGGSGPLKLGMIRALGMMGKRESYEALLPYAAAGKPPELMQAALWSLHKTQSPRVRGWLRQELEQGPGKVRECALLDALKMVSTTEDVNWARKRFLMTAGDVRCDRVVWEERDERRRTIMFSDTVRTKYMKIVANSGASKEYLGWFRSIASDPSEPFDLRQAAGEILKQFE